MTETALAVRTDTPAELMQRSNACANACTQIVESTAVNIQGKRYIPIEGWQAITTAHGCVLSIEAVTEDEEGNCTATAGVRKIQDGALIATAQGFVGIDETKWKNRPRYARRAMAQTRAMSRAARSAFAHVVVLMGRGFVTTPAEEMDEPQTPPQPPPTTSPAKPLDPELQKALMEAIAARDWTTAYSDDVLNRAMHQKGAKKLDEMHPRDVKALIKLINAGKLDPKQAA